MTKLIYYFNRWVTVFHKHVVKVSAALLCITTISACTLIGTVYQSLPKLIVYELDQYLDLNYLQYEQSTLQVEALYQWHRQQALPLIVQQLRRAADLIDKPLKPLDVHATIDWFNLSRVKFMEYTAPAQFGLLSSLTPKNLRAMEKEFASSNAKYRKKWVDGTITNLKAQRFDTIQTWFERVYGDISEEQSNALRAASDARPMQAELAYSLRIERQQFMLQMIKQQLQAPHTAKQFNAKLIEFTASMTHHTNPSYQAYLQQSRAEHVQLIVLASNLATEPQRQYAQRTLRSYANTFESIAKQP